jgi:hypothetical protein
MAAETTRLMGKAGAGPHSTHERFRCLAFDGKQRGVDPRAAALRNRVQADVDSGVRDVGGVAR